MKTPSGGIYIGERPQPAIRVTVEDLESGEVEVRELDNDYLLLCAGNRYLDGIQSYGNGTHVLTIKINRETP